MSLFSAALSQVLEGRKWTQSDTAAAVGLSQAAVSKYLGGRRPDQKSLELICEVLDEYERAQLLLAHLRDEVPQNYRDLVHLTATAGSPTLKEEAIEGWRNAPLPRDVMQSLELIAREAAHDESVRELIRSTANILR